MDSRLNLTGVKVIKNDESIHSSFSFENVKSKQERKLNSKSPVT
jgi:hypothetical protein